MHLRSIKLRAIKSLFRLHERLRAFRQYIHMLHELRLLLQYKLAEASTLSDTNRRTQTTDVLF